MVATLAAAFQDDPALGWIIPDAAERRARLPLLFTAIVAADLRKGSALCSPEHEVVTLWRHAGHAAATIGETLQNLPGFVRALGPHILRGLKVSQAIEAHHPRNLRFAYLHYAGVAPAEQGRGWGGRAIRHGIAQARPLPAFLETATPANVGLYQNLGFRTVAEWDVPGGGPHFWSMLRPPDAAQPD
ncbi:N-acetyltransferase [Polymorphobacter multimanifer]|nr:GNAT family N-acetyltransferase [Polymorphobacter multimanifer]GGI79909.1 N-acetyltransferase [Polymorphobacter multimanifer]